ncbi:MAG: endonuclease/exonuclease/phosphatase family protein [Hyphomonas sp.]
MTPPAASPGNTRLRAGLLAALLALSAAGCSHWPGEQTQPCDFRDARPDNTVSDDGSVHTTQLSVLIYNVEGLPWPARRNRGPSLDKIGEELARMRQAGTAPDVVLVQEAFTPRAARIGAAAAYPNRVRGPSRSDVPETGLVDQAHIDARRFRKGERSGKLLGSGLYVFSDLPVIGVYRRGFSRHACAGLDCLSAKGAMLVRIALPGVPTPVDLMTVHMNAQGSARVREARTLAAHRYQTLESAHFLLETRDPANPLILGGDFNMRRSPDRLDHFDQHKPYMIVHRWCTDPANACDVRMSWDGDEPWLDTQDLQAFDDGEVVSLRPERVEAVFDGPETGGRLSDHDGYLVTYTLSWPAAAPALRTCLR